MSRIRRPSPALVVAIMALVAAIAVPAFALTKKEKRVVRKIASAQITKRASGLAVASAKDAADTAEVETPARIVLNDQTPGDDEGERTDVLVAGVFTVEAVCAENPPSVSPNELAFLILHGPSGSSFSGQLSNGPELKTLNGTLHGFAIANASGNDMSSGHLVGVAPNGDVVSVSGSAEVNDPAGECVLGVTAVGP